MTRVWWVAFQGGRFGIGFYTDGHIERWSNTPGGTFGFLIGHNDPVPTSQET